jgi:hypothetical protein
MCTISSVRSSSSANSRREASVARSVACRSLQRQDGHQPGACPGGQAPGDEPVGAFGQRRDDRPRARVGLLEPAQRLVRPGLDAVDVGQDAVAGHPDRHRRRAGARATP